MDDVDPTIVKPITPQEALSQRVKIIPPGVIKCWNDAIVASMISENSKFVIKQDYIVGEIAKAMYCSVSEVFENKWLDIEAVYSEAGWNVEYHRPDYYESWKSYYEFTPKHTTKKPGF